MTALSVNLNAVAMLRNRRDVGWPSVTGIARVVLDAGAHGVTVHPRPDERHIRTTDVYELADLLRNDYPRAEFNIEGYPDERFLKLVEAVKPHQVTLVPDDPGQSTSDHGWDIAANEQVLKAVIARLHGSGLRVSLFIDEDPNAPALAAMVGADRVELYTGPYGASFRTDEGREHLDDLVATANAAREARTGDGGGRPLGINIGHDLTLENLPSFVAAVGQVDEASIGHGITADALILGFAEAVRRYKAVLA
ncbi:MAG: pyridoxine 5'-phosphate synthase [Hyphomicrobiaceae bacterium]|nr:pyridoxine 5'-phosphate synthase [Hyphomicrobiaceae bacterium]MCC0024734.1 pyridoxine 5'-phosphate synthase [Hyphomicrobiaceae bacterium]